MSEWTNLDGSTDSPIESTSVPVDQLQAQGYKYTPAQMAAFDRGRGQILASESQSDSPPPQAEINNLNPQQLSAFNDNLYSDVPSQTSNDGWKDLSAHDGWQDVTGDKHQFEDKYPTIAKNLKALDTIPGGIGSDILSTLNRGIEIGQNIKKNTVGETIKQGAKYLGDVALGTGEGIASGLGQGMGALEQLVTLDPRSNEELAKERAGVATLKTILPKSLQDAVENSIGSKDAQHLLGLPWEMSGNFVVNLLKKAGHEDLAGTVEQLLLAGMTAAPLAMKGKAGKVVAAAEEAVNKPAGPTSMVDDILGGSSIIDKTGEQGSGITWNLKGRPIDKTKAGEPEGINVTPEEMEAEFAARQPGFNFDPLQRGETADIFDNNNSVRESQPIPPDITPTPDEMQARRPINPAQTGEIPTDQIPAREAPVTPEDVRAAEGQGNLTTTYPGGASPYEPMKPLPEQLDLAPRGDSGVPPEPPGGGGSPVPLTPLQKFLARRRLAEAKNATVRRFIPRNQRGAVGDLGDAQRLDQLVKSLLNTSRDREGIKAGDTVRLMNGKVGKVLKVTEDGRYQVRHDDGSFDTVPVQGINYKYKPANQVVNAVGYPKARPLGAGPGNKQRGAVGDLGKAKVEEARRRYVEAGTHLNVAMSRAGINDKALWDRAFDKVLENHNDFNSVQGLDEATRKLHAEAQRWMNSDQAQALGLKATHEAIAKEAAEEAISNAKQRHPFNGVGKKQIGALNLGAFWSKKPKATTSDSTLEPKQAKDSRVPLSREAEIDITYRMYARARNPDDFKNNLRLVRKRNSNFPQEAVDRSDELWNKFEEGYRPDKSLYSTLSSMNKRDVIALRPISMAMDEIKVDGKPLSKKVLTDADDLGYISKEFASPMHIITLNWGKPAAELFANVHGELTDIKAMWEDRLGEWMTKHKPYLDLKRASQIAVDRAEEFWDNHQVLTDRQLMWPTKQMLMDKNFSGLSAAEADAYLSHADAYMDAYKAAGIERPPIPGYMPHVWQGSWRINIYDKEGLAGVQRMNTRWQANRVAKDMSAKGYRVEVIRPKVSNKGDYIRVMEETLLQAKQFGKLGVAVAKKIEKDLFNSIEGTITESMERRGIKGYIQNEVSPNFNPLHPLDSIKGMTKTRINNNLRSGLFERSMNDFARAGRNAQIIEGVARPFYQNISNMRQAKRLVDGVGDLISVATGVRAQEFIPLDRWARQVLISMGASPSSLKDFIEATNAFARVQRINSFNLGFTAEHLYFGFPGLLDLRRMDLDRAAAGEPRGNYFKAVGRFGLDFSSFGIFHSKEGKFAEQWAKDNGVYGGHYYDEPEFKSLAGKTVGALTHGTLTAVVNRMKSVNFHMAYQYFRDIMPENEALLAAKQHTKKVMQSFDPLDRPEVFNEGTPGIALRTFNQIKLYNLSRIGEMMKSIKDAALSGNPSAYVGHIVNLIGLGALFTALGGAAGIPFHEDWEWLRKKGEEMFPMWSIEGRSVWQSYEELMARAGVPNFIIMGMLPKLTGIDTRHTFEINVGNTFSGAGLEAAAEFAKLVTTKIAGWITGKENPAHVYQAKTKLLPTTLVPWLQDEEAKKLSGNIPNSNLDPTTPRSEAEDLIYKITSKKATSESQRNEFMSLLKDIDARNTKIREAYVDMIVKKMSGFDTGRKDVNELIDDALKQDIGFDIGSLNEQIIKKIKDEHLSQAIKYIMEAAHGSSTNLKANRFRNMQMLLQGGQLGK